MNAHSCLQLLPYSWSHRLVPEEPAVLSRLVPEELATQREQDRAGDRRMGIPDAVKGEPEAERRGVRVEGS